ncbi:ribonuclease HI [Actinoalloteichus hymeniacidonis]|nr:ribonuclease HI [Actinoalloteichus hymeniacidonis]
MQDETEQVVDVYTDGGCSPNPGPGGWGVVLRYGGHERELYGSESGVTTNNRMELTAPIRALESLTRDSVVRMHTDSTYVRNGITQWLPKWKANGWRTSTREPVKNADLWRLLEAASARHRVEWLWVKGHAGNPDNERADRLATKGVQEAGGKVSAPVRVTTVRKPGATGTKVSADRSASTGPRCQAVTKSGAPCRTVARASGLCHVHDPAVQCGATTASGKPCAVATGGGRCERHSAQGETAPALF